MATTATAQQGSKYKWYILVLMALTGTFFVAMPQMCMPVLFPEIAKDLNLDVTQIGVVWAMMPLAGLFVIFLGGLLADKFGTKKVLVIGCFLTGLTGILRGFADSFTTLVIYMFIFGVLQIITSPALVRACSLWFSGKPLGLANGVLSTSMGFGFLVSAMISASVLSPLLGGWQNVLIAYGVLSIFISVLWFFTKSKPDDVEEVAGEMESISIKESILKVVKVKKLWILGIIMALHVGSVQGTLGYLPLYLQDYAGWNPDLVGLPVATFNGMSTVFTVAIVILSGRLGTRKWVMFGAVALTALGVGLLTFNSGAGVWVAMSIAGMVRDGFMATHMTMTLETEGVETKYAGSAIGFVQTVARVGEIISPPMGNSLAKFNPRFPFIVWSGMAVAALFVFAFLKEQRHKNRLPLPANQ